MPSALLRAANLEEKNLSQEVARLLALELYREDKVSLGRATELCQTPLPAFLEVVAKRKTIQQAFSLLLSGRPKVGHSERKINSSF